MEQFGSSAWARPSNNGRPYKTVVRIFFASAVLSGAAVQAATAPVQTVLHTFGSQSGDGVGLPAAGLILASDGNFYGTTQMGGANNAGSIFRIGADGTLTTLYSFCSDVTPAGCADGQGPLAPLVEGSDGNFYGTTAAGGANANGGPAGTVFVITPAGQLTTLYSFCSTGGSACTDGAASNAALLQGSDGNFYGTTFLGGAGGGTLFSITPDGVLTTLHTFCASGPGCLDGSSPVGALVEGGDGTLYGTTSSNGQNGGGTVFRASKQGTLAPLYSFCDVQSAGSCPDGSYPLAGLAFGADGTLYGTTAAAGANSTSQTAGGTVFNITTDGALTTLYSFCGAAGCTDGSQPLTTLMLAADGNFYGTTFQGGAAGTPSGTTKTNNGTVFSINPSSGAFTSVYSFCSVVQSGFCADGRAPLGALVADSAGNLYGTTLEGGLLSGSSASEGGGTIYKLGSSSGSGGGTGGVVMSTSGGAINPLMLAFLGGAAMLKRLRRRSSNS